MTLCCSGFEYPDRCIDCEGPVWDSTYTLFDPVTKGHAPLCKDCYQARQPKEKTEPVVSIILDKGAKMTYVPPKGCDFIPVNPQAGFEVESGTCVCAPEWGHNAKVYDQYKTSAPPQDDEGPGTEGGPYNRHTKWTE